jgi:hypothetical protein
MDQVESPPAPRQRAPAQRLVIPGTRLGCVWVGGLTSPAGHLLSLVSRMAARAGLALAAGRAQCRRGKGGARDGRTTHSQACRPAAWPLQRRQLRRAIARGLGGCGPAGRQTPKLKGNSFTRQTVELTMRTNYLICTLNYDLGRIIPAPRVSPSCCAAREGIWG